MSAKRSSASMAIHADTEAKNARLVPPSPPEKDSPLVLGRMDSAGEFRARALRVEFGEEGNDESEPSSSEQRASDGEESSGEASWSEEQGQGEKGRGKRGSVEYSSSEDPKTKKKKKKYRRSLESNPSADEDSGGQSLSGLASGDSSSDLYAESGGRGSRKSLKKLQRASMAFEEPPLPHPC